ncbi:hypothetical protein H2200_004210 [Cladophialophora chaetospira]|uniref:Uncharacterized protein n=1 Tax=Cladophialophora chaetospira TaxID=386627 RepID=A0AA38XFN8_9EURO|nr:hypothetical protein H2200_004210 [Cladophialophora chaetospira]
MQPPGSQSEEIQPRQKFCARLQELSFGTSSDESPTSRHPKSPATPESSPPQQPIPCGHYDTGDGYFPFSPMESRPIQNHLARGESAKLDQEVAELRQELADQSLLAASLRRKYYSLHIQVSLLKANKQRLTATIPALGFWLVSVQSSLTESENALEHLTIVCEMASAFARLILEAFMKGLKDIEKGLMEIQGLHSQPSPPAASAVAEEDVATTISGEVQLVEGAAAEP